MEVSAVDSLPFFGGEGDFISFITLYLVNPSNWLEKAARTVPLTCACSNGAICSAGQTKKCIFLPFEKKMASGFGQRHHEMNTAPRVSGWSHLSPTFYLCERVLLIFLLPSLGIQMSPI